MGIERRREIRRRRSRRKKINLLKRKAEAANASEKASIARKIRQLTPGGNELVARLALEDR